MKWTTFLLLGFVLDLFAQHPISLLKTPVTRAPVSKRIRSLDTVIPLEIIRGLAFVNANVEQIDGRYLLDTGAPSLVLHQTNFSKQKAIPAASFTSDFEIYSTTVKRFLWAGIERKALEVLVLNIQHLEEASKRPVAGIIGYDILKNFELFIDYSHTQLLLLKPGKNKLHIAAEPIATLEFELQDHLPVIEIQIDGQTFRFGLDTGAGVNLMDNNYKASLSESLLVSLEKEEIRTINQQSSLVEGALIKATQLQDQEIGEMKYLFADLSHLKSNTLLNIDGLLGFPFFERVKCSIDYPNKRLYIWSILD